MLHAVLPSLSATLLFFVSAAFLAPEDFGQLAIATGLVSLSLAFSPVAFGEALVQRQNLTAAHANAVFWLNGALAVVYTVALVIAAPTVSRWFGVTELSWILPLLALKVPFEFLSSVPSAMIVRQMRFRLLAIRTAAASVIGMIVSITLLLSGFGLLSLVVAQVFVSMTTFAVAIWTSGWKPGREGSVNELRELSHYGLFASGHRMLGLVRVDHLVLGALGGPALLGLMVFAQRILAILSSIASGALASVLHVVLSSMQSEPEKARRAFSLITFGAATAGFPIFAGAALIIDDVINLFFADNWSEAASAAQIFCLAGFFSTLGVVQGALIRSRGHADWLFYYQLAQEILTVAAVALFYSQGLEVLVAVILIKTASVFPVSIWMALRLVQASFWQYTRSFLRPAFATAVMVAGLLTFPSTSDLTGILAQVFLGALIYPLVLATIAWDRLTEAWGLALRKPEISK